MKGKKQKGNNQHYSALPGRPIMVYPTSHEQRERIVVAAEGEGSKLSPFILRIVEDYLTATQSLEADMLELASLEKRCRELKTRIAHHQKGTHE